MKLAALFSCEMVCAILVMVGCKRSGDPQKNHGSNNVAKLEKHVILSPPLGDNIMTQMRDRVLMPTFCCGKQNDLDVEIFRVREVVLETVNNDGKFLRQILDRIEELGDRTLRWKYYRKLWMCALSVRFEDIRENPPKVPTGLYSGFYSPHPKLSQAHGNLQRMIEETGLWLYLHQAPFREQFEPLLCFAEKMRDESIRIGCNANGYPEVFKNIERWYYMGQEGEYSQEDVKWLKTRFEQLAKRPFRTKEQMRADSGKEIDAHLLIGEARAAYERRRKMKTVK